MLVSSIRPSFRWNGRCGAVSQLLWNRNRNGTGTWDRIEFDGVSCFASNEEIIIIISIIIIENEREMFKIR